MARTQRIRHTPTGQSLGQLAKNRIENVPFSGLEGLGGAPRRHRLAKRRKRKCKQWRIAMADGGRRMESENIGLVMHERQPKSRNTTAVFRCVCVSV